MNDKDLCLPLTPTEAAGLLAHIQSTIRDGMNARRDGCFWCGADLTEREHNMDCGIPLLLTIEERLVGLLAGQGVGR